jgi:hypothetical protein
VFRTLTAAVVAAVVATLMMALVLQRWAVQTTEINQVVHDNCVAIEKLKAGGRAAVLASIRSDFALLNDHQDKTAYFYRQVVIANIFIKRQTIKESFSPQPCP